MQNKINLLLILITLQPYTYLGTNELNKDLTGLEKLMHQIFVINKYNDLVRPVDRENGLTNIQTELKLLQIDLDEKYQKLITTAWFEMIWNDTRFSWDPFNYETITEITVPVAKIWTPDIVLQYFKIKDQKCILIYRVGENDYLTEFKYFNPWISHTGSVTWVPEIRLHTKCSIKVKDFPFDKQCCEISFYSWAHTAKQMTIKQVGNKKTTNISHISDNTEWKIYHTCASNQTIRTGENLDWWVTTYVVFIQRNSLYHVYTLLMPCIVLSILSSLLFLLPPDSGEKISLGVTILLAFFVNTLVVANYTPEATAELPVIGLYYTFNIIFVAISLGTSIIVLRLHFRGHKYQILPRSLKKILRVKSLVKPEIENQVECKNSHISNLIFNNQDSEKLKSKKNSKATIDDKNFQSLVKILNSLQNYSKGQRKEKKESILKENIQTEWRELARKIDLVMFFVSTFTVFSVPIYLFSKYVYDTPIRSNNQLVCSCSTFK